MKRLLGAARQQWWRWQQWREERRTRPVNVLPPSIRYPLLALLGIGAVVGLVLVVRDPGMAITQSNGRVYALLGEVVVLLLGALAIAAWVGRRHRRMVRRLEQLGQLAQQRPGHDGQVGHLAEIGSSAARAAHLLRARQTEQAVSEIEMIEQRRDAALHGADDEVNAALDAVIEELARMRRTRRRIREREARVGRERRRRLRLPPTPEERLARTAQDSTAPHASPPDSVRDSEGAGGPWPSLSPSPLARRLDDLGRGSDTVHLGPWLRRARLDRAHLPRDYARLRREQAEQVLDWVERTAPAVVRAVADQHDRPEELAADATYALAWTLGSDIDGRERLLVASVLRFCVETAGFEWGEVLAAGCDPAGHDGEGILRMLFFVSGELPASHQPSGSGADFTVQRIPALLSPRLVGPDADASLAPLAERLFVERARRPWERLEDAQLDPVLRHVTAAANLLATGSTDAARHHMDQAAYLVGDSWPRTDEDGLGSAVIAAARRLRAR
ncbi:hypothetical protein KLP28_13725 [Nocardioidaceae bacterium]|nr:hypothetical protein KLP28_13725 [Nocardioidaceae bacterium]